MALHRFSLTPRTMFGSPATGDSLFGHLCWTIRNVAGEAALKNLLDGYLQNKPFVSVSDAMPSGCIPRPSAPFKLFKGEYDASKRKALKRRRWLPVEVLEKPFEEWLQHAVEGSSAEEHLQSHNTINRMTGTTGTGAFAPYSSPRLAYPDGTKLDLYCYLDEERLPIEQLTELLKCMGEGGFGSDASIGLGKFTVDYDGKASLTNNIKNNALLTMAPCAPQGLGFISERSFYDVVTRFGRHGDVAALMGTPFKNPVLLADTGALLSQENLQTTEFTGQGVGGEGRLSKTIVDTVFQGYAPAIPVHLSSWQGEIH